MLILANRDQNVLLLKQVYLFGPAFNTLVPMAHSVAVIRTLAHLKLPVFRRFLQLCEELRIKHVDLFVERLWDYIVLEETQVKENQDIVEVDTGLQKLKIFLGHLDTSVEMAVD